MNWLLLALLVILGLAIVLYWALIVTEGVFLGRRVVVWLYDMTAGRYDAIKQFDQVEEQSIIGRRLMRALSGQPAPLVLDVATGTGRVPCLLLQEPAFSGRVIGLDASAKMLAQAAAKLAVAKQTAAGQAELVRQQAAPLPFADNTFDMVTCLEALEFLPSDVSAVEEMVRVLRPGGFLMTSRRRGWEGKMFLGRYRSVESFEQLLAHAGLAELRSELWQVSYDMVTGRKAGPKEAALNAIKEDQ